MAQKDSIDLLSDREVEHLEKIIKLRDPLIDIGVPGDIFNPYVYFSVGCFPRKVASHLKLFSAYKDQKKLEQVFNIGITNGMFNAISDLTARTFFQFCAFLRSRAGQDALTKLARHNRLLKRAGGELDPGDDAFLKLLESHGTDLANAVADIMREYRSEIKDLELKLDQARRERDELIDTVMEKYAPCGSYVQVIKKYCMMNTTSLNNSNQKYKH